MRRKGIREERVDQVSRIISVPGFKFDSRLLAEKIVAVVGPAFFFSATQDSRQRSSADDSLSVEDLLSLLNEAERHGLH